MRELKSNAPSRNVTDVGRGDYVKVGSSWMKIESNSAQGASATPRSWSVRAENGNTYGMWEIGRYAKAEDITE